MVEEVPLAGLSFASLFSQRRIPFELLSPDLGTFSALFPRCHPYRTYELVRRPEAATEAAEPMPPRYTIDHPLGTLIDSSVIKPVPANVLACR